MLNAHEERVRDLLAHLAGRLGHDARNPLGIISGYASLLADQDLTEAQTEDVAQISRAATELLTMLTELRDLVVQELEANS
jgi:signal transduction histidine kinase